MEHQLAAGLLAHQSRASHSRYPATSSAFSASAHPHEDWTKISDLAERRRIQNRIAQRNYRKKLKRRLEDLERKAASTSASPEPQPAQLPQQKSPARRSTSQKSSPTMSSHQPSHQHTLSSLISLPESALVSDPFFKQESQSPPTSFSYPISNTQAFSYAAAPFSTATHHYPATSTASCDPFNNFSYNPVSSSPSWLSTSATAGMLYKSDFFPELDMSSFAFQYAAAGPTAVSSLDGHSGYSESLPQTPPLSECHELYIAGASPPDSAFLPQTPPMPFQAGPTMTMV